MDMNVTRIPDSQKADGSALVNPITAEHTGFTAFVSPMRGLRTVQSTRLVGASFEGTTVDTAFWTVGTNTGATVAQANSQVVVTSSGTNSSATMTSVRRGRYLSSNSNYARLVVRIPTLGEQGNTRRWGAFDTDNGIFFQYASGVFGIVRRKNGADTVIANGDFNGDAASYSLDTNVHTYEIHWTNSAAWFYVDNTLIHTWRFSTETMCATMSLRMGLESTNNASGTAAASIECRVSSLARLGPAHARPRSFYTNTANTFVLKRSPGSLDRVIVGTRGTGGATVSFYDNVTGSGTPMFVLDGVNSLGAIDLDIDFFNGLSMVTTSGIGHITVLYD